MRIGFTGTQQGMTDHQADAVHFLIGDLTSKRTAEPWGHHGDCIGGDSKFHQICRRRRFLIVRHPPLESAKRAFCDFDIDMPKEKYLTRNRAIVLHVNVLVAAPATKHEVQRSGTWSTIRFARIQGVELRLVLPDGSIEEEEGRWKREPRRSM